MIISKNRQTVKCSSSNILPKHLPKLSTLPFDLHKCHKWTHVNCHMKIWLGVKMSEVIMSEVKMSEVKMSEVKMSEVKMSEVKMSEVIMSEVKLPEVIIKNVRDENCRGIRVRVF